jgi:serine/threonine protein kinase/tetratricopeptide (TPR) repeat protein
MIGKKISHYEIIEKLGEGGMGVVYKARDTRLDRIVALKFLPERQTSDEDAKARFIHEAKAASALDHPNICTVHDIEETEGHTFISMSYVDGPSLKDLAKGAGVPIPKIINMVVQAAEGLGAAHKKGIVHRDVKSDNIMVTGDDHVRVMDFGLAKLKGASGLTKDGRTIGTAHYMSPEQAKGEKVDHRSDIFSLGVVLYELVTGRLPFAGEYDSAVTYSILHENPAPISEQRSDVPAELESITAKALEKNPADRYQSMDELIADLANLREGRTSEIRAGKLTRPFKPAAASEPPRRSRLRVLIPVVVVLVIAAIAVSIGPKLFREEPVEASENILAVMYFDNFVDPADTGRLGEIITNLVITDLSESRFVKVVSSQRLYDILRLLGKEGAKRIDKDVATQVARKARAKWTLSGTILQTEPAVMVTAELVEVGTGHILGTQEIRGEENEEIFSVVDKLTAQVKEDLPLPEAASVEPDVPVAEVATSSPEAYRLYLEGVDYSLKTYHQEAEDRFARAIAADSTFAMAYFRLGVSMFTRGDPEGRLLLDKAVRYSNGVARRDQYIIKGYQALLTGDTDRGIRNLRRLVEDYPDEKEAYYYLGSVYWGQNKDPAEVIALLERAVEIDPQYKDPYNMLAYAYEAAGDFERSIWAINKYISLAPDEANPYDTRGELLAYAGKVDAAIESYEKALEIKPDFTPSLVALGNLFMLKGDYAKARSYYSGLASGGDPSTRSQGRTLVALIPLYRGRLERALEMLDDAIAADMRDGGEGMHTIYKHGLKAAAYKEKGDIDSAVSETEIAMEMMGRFMPGLEAKLRGYYGFILALKGELSKAEEAAEELRKYIETHETETMDEYWWLKGEIERERGDLEKAIEYLEKASGLRVPYDLTVPYGLASIYLEAGRLGDAVPVLERTVSRYGTQMAMSPIQAAKLHYLLGKAYEGSGWNEKAISQYEEFLEIWKDADPGLEDPEDARQRLARLKTAF